MSTSWPPCSTRMVSSIDSFQKITPVVKNTWRPRIVSRRSKLARVLSPSATTEEKLASASVRVSASRTDRVTFGEVREPTARAHVAVAHRAERTDLDTGSDDGAFDVRGGMDLRALSDHARGEITSRPMIGSHAPKQGRHEHRCEPEQVKPMFDVSGDRAVDRQLQMMRGRSDARELASFGGGFGIDEDRRRAVAQRLEIIGVRVEEDVEEARPLVLGDRARPEPTGRCSRSRRARRAGRARRAAPRRRRRGGSGSSRGCSR